MFQRYPNNENQAIYRPKRQSGGACVVPDVLFAIRFLRGSLPADSSSLHLHAARGTEQYIRYS